MDRYLNYVLAGIPISVGLLYLAGIIFDSSYFMAWGLDRELFPRSFNDTIVRGVFALLSISAKHSFLLVTTLFIILGILIGLTWIVEKIEFKRLSKSTNGKKEDKDANRMQQATEKPISTLFGTITLALGVITIIVSVVFILTIVMAIFSYTLTKEGESAAKAQYHELLSDPWAGESIQNVSILGKEFGNTPRRMITCSTTLCVFLTPNGVETINRELITKMVTSVKLKE